MVVECVRIVLNIIGRIGRSVSKDRVNGVPREQGAVFAVIDIVGMQSLFISRWSGCQFPEIGIMDIDIGFSSFKIIDIRHTGFSYIPRVAGDELRKLRIDLER